MIKRFCDRCREEITPQNLGAPLAEKQFHFSRDNRRRMHQPMYVEVMLELSYYDAKGNHIRSDNTIADQVECMNCLNKDLKIIKTLRGGDNRE